MRKERTIVEQGCGWCRPRMELIINTKDIRLSPDPDMAGSYAAMQRAGRAAEDLAIRTNTAIIAMIDGKVVRLTAEEIIKRREAASNTSEAPKK